MALLRILLLGLLVWVVVRLAVRLLIELDRRRRRPRAAPHRDGSDRSTSRRKRRLVACPVCGTYFEEHRGLPIESHEASAERLEVCSEACRRGDSHGDPDGGHR